jgi:hypothetical protein
MLLLPRRSSIAPTAACVMKDRRPRHVPERSRPHADVVPAQSRHGIVAVPARPATMTSGGEQEA